MNGTAKFRRLKDVGKEVYNEKGDCGVIAIALFCDVSYGKAHAALTRAGRKKRCGTHHQHMVGAIKELRGETLAPVMVGTTTKHCYTINKAPERVKHDRAILLTKGHAACMIDGIVHDWTQGRRHRVVATITSTDMRNEA